MKKTKLEIDATEATALYRALDAYEAAVKKDEEASPAVVAMTLASLGRLRDKLALAYQKTKPAEKKK